MLNIDGTSIKNAETGHEILTYSNDHIASYARAWTGFDRQFTRGNIELAGGNPNRIDPMRIYADWRDIYPKINLEAGYIGDGYPVCSDMPERAFLRKGAKYRLLGSSTKLQLTTDPPAHRKYDPLVKNVKLDPLSNLYNKLCNAATFGGNDCNFVSQVEINENLSCFGQECLVDTLHLIEVTNGIFFEYVRQPCVELAYYQNPKTITHPYRRDEMCGNPKTPVAREGCCTSGDQHGRAVNCQYSNERVTFQTAIDRCKAIQQSVCPFTYLLMNDLDELCGAESHFPHWHDSDCLLKAKINSGYVAIVHEPTKMINEKIKNDFKEDSPHFFPVHWISSEYPNESNNCGNGACKPRIDGCLCGTVTIENVAFSSQPTNLDQILSTLNIGSVSPDTFDDNYYEGPHVKDDFEVYFRNGASYDIDTIFKVELNMEIKYFKNVISTVGIIGNNGEITSYSFRNPPHFMNFARADARDAHYETEAVLKSYFYHQNVAPKIASHMIQRFGISNPSPRYVETVALAFKNGIYTFEDSSNPSITFGANKYGDMQSTIAAALLDKEARSLVLQKDPSMG